MTTGLTKGRPNAAFGMLIIHGTLKFFIIYGTFRISYIFHPFLVRQILKATL